MAREEGSGLEAQGSGKGRAVLLTPAGGAAIAVVRLAGDGVGAFLAEYFDKPAAAGRCVHGTLRDGVRVLDDPVVVISQGGAVADINLHGGPWVVRSVLDLARRHGFETDAPPSLPLPPDAVDADGEIEREVLRYLPLATTELAVRALLAQVSAWESAGPGSIDAADRSLHWLLHPPRVAIIGIPNVGKSTLGNQLFAQERSITADVPGTTRDWVGEIANVDGLPVMLVDTPGLRETRDPIEAEAIERSRAVVTGADLVVLVLDPTQPREPAQAALERAFPNAVRILNKADREAGGWEGEAMLRTVATTGQGVAALRAETRTHFLGPAPFDVVRPRCWTQRQRDLVLRPGRSA